MTSDLLKCTICPKRPGFSDVSHLLTHVGSKGHLAHLHGLQVKGHQELEAAHQLAIYNQWFQEHGVAEQLSERMQQKQIKQAEKRAANRRRMVAIPVKAKPRARKPSMSSQQLPAFSAYSQPTVLKTRLSAEDMIDLDYTPVRGSRTSDYPVLPSSPPKLLTAEYDDDFPASVDPQVRASPNTPQLKGTLWPGMDLFDAASEEAKRKRNQKKDGSVLRTLERLAGLVQPTETVHSAAGEVLKHRHMDDMEHDSPVEGEFQLPEPSPKRRKSSVVRAKRQSKKESSKKQRVRKRTGRPVGRPRKQLETPSKLPSSSIGEMVESTSRFSPTEDESREFKLAVRNMGRKKRKTKLPVYQESSSSFGVDGSSEMMPSTYIDAGTTRPQASYVPPPWQRQQDESYDPFKLIRDRFSAYAASGDIGQGKENAMAIGTNLSPQGGVMMNPLFFQDEPQAFAGTLITQNMNPTAAVQNDPFHDDNTFMPVRNPLMAALQRLRSPKVEGFGFDMTQTATFATQYRQPLFAP